MLATRGPWHRLGRGAIATLYAAGMIYAGGVKFFAVGDPVRARDGAVRTGPTRTGSACVQTRRSLDLRRGRRRGDHRHLRPRDRGHLGLDPPNISQLLHVNFAGLALRLGFGSTTGSNVCCEDGAMTGFLARLCSISSRISWASIRPPLRSERSRCACATVTEPSAAAVAVTRSAEIASSCASVAGLFAVKRRSRAAARYRRSGMPIVDIDLRAS